MMRYLASLLDPHAFVIAKTTGMSTDALTRREKLICGVTLAVSIIAGAANLLIYWRFPWLTIKLLGPVLPFSFGIWLLLNVLPFVIAAATAVFASQHTRAEHYRLLALTSISGQAMFQGLWIAALYRFRTIVIVAVALVPVLIMTQIGQFAIPATAQTLSYDLTMAMFMVIGSTAGIRLVGAVLLGAELGVYAGISRTEIEAILYAGIIMLLYYAIHLIFAGIGLGLVSISVLILSHSHGLLYSILIGLLTLLLFGPLAVIPYAVALNELRAPRHFRFEPTNMPHSTQG